MPKQQKERNVFYVYVLYKICFKDIGHQQSQGKHVS